MAALFTVIAEFTGTTNVSQATAMDATLAMQAWAKQVRVHAPLGQASADLADAVVRGLDGEPPTPIDGARNVWCVTALCEDDLFVAHIVETARG